MQQVTVPGGGGSFNAVVSLKTPEQVQQFAAAIKRIVDASATLLDDLRADASAWRPLLQDIVLLIKLCWVFVEVCLEEQAKTRASDLVAEMEEAKKSLARLCLDLQNSGAGLTRELANGMIVQIQNLLIRTASLTDEMEADQVFRVKRSAKHAFTQLLVLKDTASDFMLDGKLATAQEAWAHLGQVLDNRLAVLAPSGLKEELANAREVVAFHGGALVDATRAYVAHPDVEAGQARVEAIQQLAAAVQFIVSRIDETLTRASCSFQQDVINAKLAAFEDAVQHGSTSEAAANAKFLIDELNKLKSNSSLRSGDADNTDELSASCDKLQDMTRKLIMAAKDAIENKDGGGDALKSTLSDVKSQVAQVAQIEQVTMPASPSNGLRLSLLQAAKDMGTGMETFVHALTPPPERRV